MPLFHRYLWRILPKYSRTLPKRSAAFSDTCLKFMAIFCKIVIIFLEIQHAISFSVLQPKKLTKSCGTVVEVHHDELEQLIFAWQGRQLVLALFVSRFYIRWRIDSWSIKGAKIFVLSRLPQIPCAAPFSGSFFRRAPHILIWQNHL